MTSVCTSSATAERADTPGGLAPNLWHQAAGEGSHVGVGVFPAPFESCCSRAFDQGARRRDGDVLGQAARTSTISTVIFPAGAS